LVAAIAAAAIFAGCCGPFVWAKPCPREFLGQEELVARHNANAERAPRLWARAAVQAHLVDSKGRAVDWGSTLLAPNAILCLEKESAGGPLGPHDFVLIGSEMGEPIFRLGTSVRDGVYYLWTNVGSSAGGLYGQTALAGAPGAGALPMNPLDLVSVLGITPLPEDFTRAPTVLMRLNDTPCECAYVLTLVDRQPVTGRLVARRDVYLEWEANREPRAFRVDLLDEAGRVAMTARLKDYKPVAVVGAEGAPSDPPAASPAEPIGAAEALVPTDIEIVWPKTGSRIRIVLSEMKTKRVDPDLFLFWERLPGGVRKNLTCVDPPTSTAPSREER
jgi:hypothetical protein